MIASANERVRVAELDALRGLAAASVVMRHVFNAVVMPLALRRALLQSPLALLLNGQGAVQMFFVLSGWVLAASLERSRESAPWLPFYLRRIFRIHPPYVFGVLLAWTASFWYPPPAVGHGLTLWFRLASAVRLGPQALLASLSFPGHADGLLPVGWTLEVEMIFSFLLPLLVAAARPLRGVPLLLASAALLALPETYHLLWYSLDFALGIVAYRERDTLARALAARPAWARAAAVALGLVLFTGPLLLGWSRPAAGILVSGFAPREVLMMGVGAVLLVATATSLPSLQRALAWRPLRFLGRVSYSLYLVHFTVLLLLAPYVMTTFLPGRGLALLAVVLGASLALSAASFRWVERPSIALGNRAQRWLLSRRPGVALLAAALLLLGPIACRGPTGLPTESPLELLPSRATPVPDDADHAARDLAVAALADSPAEARARLAPLDQAERERSDAGEPPSGLAAYGQHLVDATQPDPIAYRRASAALLERDDVDPALRKQLQEEVDGDPLRLARIRIGESRMARLARDLNPFAEALGKSVLTVALLPMRLAQAAIGVAVAEHMDDPISLQERQALSYWKEFVETQPQAPESRALLARIESMQARWFATKRKRSVHAAEQALAAGEDEVALVLADRALRYAPEDGKASALRAEAERRVEARRADLARSLAPPREAPADASDPRARPLAVALLDSSGDPGAAAAPLLVGPPDAPLSSEARFAQALAEGERGHESAMWDELGELGDADPATHPMARHARQLVTSPEENPYDAFETARRKGHEEQAGYVLFGSLAHGARDRELPRPVEWLLEAPSLVGTVSGMPARLIETVAAPPAKAPAVHAANYLARYPDGEHAVELREWLIDHEEAAGNHVHAYELAAATEGFDAERLADLERGAAEQALQVANKQKRRDLRLAMLAEIARRFPDTESAHRANQLVHEELENATAQRIRISRGFLIENPRIAGPAALGLRPELLDGNRSNGELHPDGVMLIGGRTLEFSLLAESGKVSDPPRLMRQTVSAERLARLVSLLEETAQHNALLDPLADVGPDPQRDLFFERARLGVSDVGGDDDPTAASSYAFVGVREKYGLVRSRESILPVDIVISGSLPDLGLGAFPRLRTPKETPDAMLYR